MKTVYFTPGMLVAEIKSTYKTLAMRWHPDRVGGNTAIMQEINAAYKEALAMRHGEETEDETGTVHTNYYKEATEEAVIEKMAATIASGILNDPTVELWLIGVWLWIKGDTRPHKETLGRSGLGYNWNGSRECWQWHVPTGFRTKASPDGFDSIAARYGGGRVTAPTRNIEE